MVWFADEVLGAPLDPWERWLVIHAGELLPDGTPRFRTVLILVARQNGKTHLLVVLTLYWMFVERHPMVLGISSKLAYAKEPWQKALNMARASEWTAAEVGGERRTNGEQEFWTNPSGPTAEDPNAPNLPDGCRYTIAAATEDAGRSLTVNRLVFDELRRQKSFTAYDAATPTQNAVWDAQCFCLSNQGPEDAVVLDHLRDSALLYLTDPDLGDYRLGLFEWSMPYTPGGRLPDPTDLDGLAQANPNVGRRNPWDPLIGQAKRAKAAGGKALMGFLTEVGCVRVRRTDPAVDPVGWEQGGVPAAFTPYERARTACVVDVSLDGMHAALLAAAVTEDGRVRVEVVAVWEGPGCLTRMRKELRAKVRRVRPRAFGWFPDGPAAAVAAELTAPPDRGQPPPAERRWPARCEIRPIGADVRAACMGFAEMASSGQVLHPLDPLLTGHVTGAERLWVGDAWRFTRRGAGHVNVAYAAAGAVHLARTLPPPPPPARLVLPSKRRSES